MFDVFMFGLSSAAFVSTLRPGVQKWVVRAYIAGYVIGGLF